MARLHMLTAAAAAALALSRVPAEAMPEYGRGHEPGPPTGRGPGQGHKQALRKIKAKGGPKRTAKRRPPRVSK